MGWLTIENGRFLCLWRVKDIGGASSTSCGPISTYAMYATHLQRAPMQAKVQIYSLKNASRTCTFLHSFPKEHFNGMLKLVMDEESSTLGQPQLITGSLEQNKSDKIPADKIEGYLLHEGLQDKTDRATNSAKDAADICDKEIQRRRKIGLANKGRTPWNKGRKHSQETRERIKRRTIEALRDPKVRKKMSEYPHSHSDMSKARIGATLRRIWEARLKHKRSQEECYLIWARSIAEAARVGGHDQQELGWDSYEKLKADIALQYLRWKSRKAKAKEIAKLRAERMAKVRAEKLAMLAQQRKEREEKAEARKLKALERKKSEDEKKKIALSKGFKLRLKKVLSTKFHHRKKLLESSDGIQRQMVVKPRPVDEKWDMERIKTEKMQRVSLADQIRAVKNKKAEYAAHEVLETASSDSSVEEKEGDKLELWN